MENLYQKGLRKLEEVDGKGGQNVIDSLKDIAPDLGKYIIEFAFGEIYCRNHLGLKEREIATVSALVAKGGCEPQLKVHIKGALNVGCSKEEIIEIIIQMAVYAGFPAALNGIFVAKQVFSEESLNE